MEDNITGRECRLGPWVLSSQTIQKTRGRGHRSARHEVAEIFARGESPAGRLCCTQLGGVRTKMQAGYEGVRSFFRMPRPLRVSDPRGRLLAGTESQLTGLTAWTCWVPSESGR